MSLGPHSPESCGKLAVSKDEYGKPIHGSLTEFRGQKANIQISKEVFELCYVIDKEGIPISEEDPGKKQILFGDLFQLYTYISNKVVGVLLRARKYGFIQFEGEMLFQRRDDNVPIFMLKSLQEIRKVVEGKQNEVISCMTSEHKPTTVLQNQ